MFEGTSKAANLGKAFGFERRPTTNPVDINGYNTHHRFTCESTSLGYLVLFFKRITHANFIISFGILR